MAATPYPKPRSGKNTPIPSATNAVRIENIPKHSSHHDVVTLFRTLIGDVGSTRSFKGGSGGVIEMTFTTGDAAKKAMCMNGYSIEGTNLLVRAVPTATTNVRESKRGQQADPRRNLYVLGLPFALTKSDLIAMFSKYGKVSHCVILATVDNSSRRRGFVVMGSHEEAKSAMENLSNKPMKGGQTLDISWAVVQRSQGFLDGGDREIFQDLPTDEIDQGDSRRQRSIGSNSSTDSADSSTASALPPTPLITSRVPTSILLFKNLPSMLFACAEDLHPLLFPYGLVNKLEIIDEAIKGTLSGSVAAIVEYAELGGALDALEGLHGQFYAEHRICAEFLRPAPASTYNHHNACPMDGFQPRPRSTTGFGLGSTRPKLTSVISSNKLSFKNNATPTSSSKGSSPSSSPAPSSSNDKENSAFQYHPPYSSSKSLQYSYQSYSNADSYQNYQNQGPNSYGSNTRWEATSQPYQFPLPAHSFGSVHPAPYAPQSFLAQPVFYA